jgi:hypothetical protein
MNKNLENMAQCSCFEKCNQNLCVLDNELFLRVGGESDKCRFMRNPTIKKINGREFVSGGAVMSNGILRSVPQRNLKWLNEANKMRKTELNNLGPP